MANDATTSQFDIPAPTQPSGKGLLNFNLGALNRAFRKISLNSPLLGTLLFGAGTGLAAYHAGPWLTKKLVRLVSPSFESQIGDLDAYMTPEDRAEQRRKWGWAGSILGAMTAAAYNFNPKAPWYGFLEYPKLSKNESSEWNSLPIGAGMQLIQDDPMLTPEMKLQSMSLLNSFNAPPTTQINGGDLVGQAIATGQSAATGMAVGYLTANILGLPNPKSTAILGAVANTLGIGPAITTSVVFGH